MKSNMKRDFPEIFEDPTAMLKLQCFKQYIQLYARQNIHEKCFYKFLRYNANAFILLLVPFKDAFVLICIGNAGTHFYVYLHTSFVFLNVTRY